MQGEDDNSCTHDPPILETRSSESNRTTFLRRWWTFQLGPSETHSHGGSRQLPDASLPSKGLCLEFLSSVTPVGGILARTKVETEGRLKVLDSWLPGVSSAPTDKKANWKCPNNLLVPLQRASSLGVEKWFRGGEKGTQEKFPTCDWSINFGNLGDHPY